MHFLAAGFPNPPPWFSSAYVHKGVCFPSSQTCRKFRFSLYYRRTFARALRSLPQTRTTTTTTTGKEKRKKAKKKRNATQNHPLCEVFPCIFWAFEGSLPF